MYSFDDLERIKSLCLSSDSDVIVKMESNGQTFQAHSEILCAQSAYFKTRLEWKKREREGERNANDDEQLSPKMPKYALSFPPAADLQCVSITAMDILMRYLHSGDIILNKLNAEEVLRAADFLQINNIIPKCVDFLAQHTFGDDKVFTLREIFHSIPTLVSRATEYIQNNFHLVTTGSEFLEIEVAEVIRLLESEANLIDYEDEVYDAAIRWLNWDLEHRQEFAIRIFDTIRFLRLSKEFFHQVVFKNPLPCKFCPDKIAATIAYHEGVPEVELSSSLSAKPRIGERTIYTIGFHCDSHADYASKIERFDRAAMKWSTLEYDNDDVTNSLMDNLRDRIWFGLCTHRRNLYLFGGRRDKSLTRECLSFNPYTVEWTTLQPLRSNRDSFCTLPIGDLIYACGGHGGCVSVEAYCPERDHWIDKRGMNIQRSDHAGVVIDGVGYVIGGIGRRAYVTERFDPRVGQWEMIAENLMHHEGLAATVFQGKIYACGGYGYSYSPRPAFGNDIKRNICEIYDPVANKWSFGPSMIKGRESFGLIADRTRLYAFGGYVAQNTMEVLNPSETDAKWRMGPSFDSISGPVKAVIF